MENQDKNGFPEHTVILDVVGLEAGKLSGVAYPAGF
jgi:hypothetical protein